LLRIALEAEAFGLDSVWVSDHLVYPLGAPAKYPYSPTGDPPFDPEDGYLEALSMLAVLAGATSRIRLGTSVLVLPMRPLLLTAKSIATIDFLAGGRVVLAVADGWWRAEFEALGADFEARRATLDEQITALRTLWTSGQGAAAGPHVRFPDLVARPCPAQVGGPEIWIGGKGPRAWKRIATGEATGWHGIGYDVEQIRSARAAIDAECGRSGRNIESVRYSTATGLPSAADRIRARLGLLRDAGVDQVVLIPRSDTLVALLVQLETLGKVVPEFE
jgi:probable F420-dependent oxidoreductase